MENQAIVSTSLQVQKVHCIANIVGIISNMKDSGEKLPTGRRVSTAHLGAALGMVELLAIHVAKHNNLTLQTNRRNMADALLCCPRSIYNYLLDFEQMGILHWRAIPHGENPDDIVIHINFSNEIYKIRGGVGQHRSDVAPLLDSPIGKVCHNHINKEKQENKKNSSVPECGKDACTKIEEKQEEKKEKQGQQKCQNSDKMAVSDVATFELTYSNFEQRKFRDLPEDAQKQVAFFAAALWKQAQQNLWSDQRFNKNIAEQSTKLIALELIHQAERNEAARSEKIKAFCQNPMYQAAAETQRQRMLKKFISSLPFELGLPYRGAFSLLSRAIEIQRENADKKGYKLYFPVFYFSDCFDKSIRYAVAERRSMVSRKSASTVRLEHCEAKMRIADAVASVTGAHQRFGMRYALDHLRIEAKKFNKWLQTTTCIDKQVYADRFAKQMNCLK